MQFYLLNIPRDRPLADKRVRQAINFAIDRKAIIETIMYNAVVPVATFCTEIDFGCDASVPPFPYDPARARALLHEAGYSDGFDMTILATNGTYPGDYDMTLAVADQLSTVGIRAQPVVSEYGIYLQQLVNRKIPQDAALVPSSSFLGHAHTIPHDILHSKGFISFWSNRDADQLLDTIQVTLDETRAKDLFRRLQTLYKDEAPAATLFTYPNAYGLHRDLEWTARVDQLLPVLGASWKRR